jgi:hypothetical protein
METRKDQIRAPWEIAAVQAKPETTTVQAAPQQHFWLRILAANSAHVEPPLLGCQNIRHFFLTISHPAPPALNRRSLGTSPNSGPRDPSAGNPQLMPFAEQHAAE